MGVGEDKRAAARQGGPWPAESWQSRWASLPKPLRWMLGATLAGTAAVLTLPAPDAEVGSAASQTLASPEATPSASTASRPGALWSAWQHNIRPEFAEAEADPFGSVAVPTPVVAAPAPVAAQAPSPPPPPPQTQFRVQGWFGMAGNAPQLLLSDGQQELVAKPGLALPDGFVIRVVEARGVVLVHAPSQTEAVLPLPESLPRQADAGTAVRASR